MAANIDLKGKVAFIAGVADSQGYGWAITRALADAGATIIVGTWPPVLKIFQMGLRKGQFDSDSQLSDGSKMVIEKVYPLDAVFDVPEDVPAEIKENKRYAGLDGYTISEVAKAVEADYGKIDILWLDGGWVRPLSTVDTSVEWQKGIKDDQDIDMKKIATMARSYNPGMLVVDRSVSGIFENYTTPEQEVPETPLSYPWETCMTMGNSWSYVPNDTYKTSRQLIHLLVKIVSRGGNFLLNIGPGPNGDFDPVAYERLKDIGDWMKMNSSGIYNSKPIVPYSSGNIFFTKNKSDQTVYAFYLAAENEKILPETVTVRNFLPAKGAKISIFGATGNLKWKVSGNDLLVTVPKTIQQYPPGQFAWCFKIKQ